MSTIRSRSIWEGPPDPAWGVFSGDPDAVWLVAGDPMNRMMQLQADLTFTDRDGKPWPAPKGLISDGASIPRPLWSLVGSPFTGAYRRAALAHDYQCDQFPDDSPGRQAADEMFYGACRAGGCSAVYAYILYLGVRIGALASITPRWAAAAEEPGGRVTLTQAEQDMQSDYQDMATELVGADGSKPVADDAKSAIAAVEAVLNSRGFLLRDIALDDG